MCPATQYVNIGVPRTVFYTYNLEIKCILEVSLNFIEIPLTVAIDLQCRKDLLLRPSESV